MNILVPEYKSMLPQIIELYKMVNENQSTPVPDFTFFGWVLENSSGAYWGTRDGEAIFIFTTEDKANKAKKSLGGDWQVKFHGVVDLEKK